MISKETSGSVLKNIHYQTFSIMTRKKMWSVFHGIVIRIKTQTKI